MLIPPLMIPLGGTPCIACQYPGGTLVVEDKPRHVRHCGWRCELPAGPVTVALGFDLAKGGDRPVPSADSRHEERLAKRRRVRAERLSRRRLIDGRLVAVELPVEKHGRVWAYDGFGCQCEPCVGARRDREAAARGGKESAA